MFISIVALKITYISFVLIYKNKLCRCFKCNSFGNKASKNKCSIQTNSPKNLDSEINPLHEMHKLETNIRVIIDALIDIGRHVSLLSNDYF